MATLTTITGGGAFTAQNIRNINSNFSALNTGGDSGGSILHQDTVTLTNDQVIALPTTGVEVIPQPGANKVVIPIAFAGYVHVITPWTGLTNASLVLMQGANYVSCIVSTVGMTADGKVCMSMAPYAEAGGGTFDTALIALFQTNMVNKATLIKDDWNGVLDYTGGHPDNYAIISVTYLILNTSTGLFE